MADSESQPPALREAQWLTEPFCSTSFPNPRSSEAGAAHLPLQEDGRQVTVTETVLKFLAVRFYQDPRYPNQTETEEKRLEATQGVWKAG